MMSRNKLELNKLLKCIGSKTFIKSNLTNWNINEIMNGFSFSLVIISHTYQIFCQYWTVNLIHQPSVTK